MAILAQPIHLKDALLGDSSSSYILQARPSIGDSCTRIPSSLTRSLIWRLRFLQFLKHAPPHLPISVHRIYVKHIPRRFRFVQSWCIVYILNTSASFRDSGSSHLLSTAPHLMIPVSYSLNTPPGLAIPVSYILNTPPSSGGSDTSYIRNTPPHLATLFFL